MKHFNPQMYAALKANEEKSKKFFEENGKKAGVKTTTSGLQYEVITEEWTKTKINRYGKSRLHRNIIRQL